VLESANPEFYLAHFDLTGKTGKHHHNRRSSGLPILIDTFVRPTKSPVVSIAKIRGCVRGVSSEFVLACDMRFTSRENTRLGQPEVGVGVHPGGGGTGRLPHLVGRGRALEIVLGANDFDGDTAERDGYVNRTFRTGSWTVLPIGSRAGSLPSTGVRLQRRRLSSTRSRCHPPTGSSACNQR
jgi:enoyl-CoA hydratase/carnithine racemase